MPYRSGKQIKDEMDWILCTVFEKMDTMHSQFTRLLSLANTQSYLCAIKTGSKIIRNSDQPLIYPKKQAKFLQFT